MPSSREPGVTRRAGFNPSPTPDRQVSLCAVVHLLRTQAEEAEVRPDSDFHRGSLAAEEGFTLGHAQARALTSAVSRLREASLPALAVDAEGPEEDFSPNSIAFCPCGNTSHDGINFTRVGDQLECARCSEVGDFEYVRKAESLVPESVTQLLAQVEEAIARIEQTDCEAEFGDDYEAEVKDAAADLRKALATYQAATKKGDGR
jgi:hypothetical protein